MHVNRRETSLRGQSIDRDSLSCSQKERRGEDKPWARADKQPHTKESNASGKGREISSGKFLKRLFTNARSLTNKMGELEYLVLKEEIDIIGITDTWWNEENLWDTIIPGYKIYRKDRAGGWRSGTVCER